MVARVNAPRPRGSEVVLWARCHNWAYIKSNIKVIKPSILLKKQYIQSAEKYEEHLNYEMSKSRTESIAENSEQTQLSFFRKRIY